MSKYIYIKADTNDGDYISKKSEITDDQIELIKPVIEQLKFRKDKLNEDKMHNWNEWRHNWVTSEYSESTLYDMYIETNLLTQEQVDLFDEFVPFGEYGVHTVESVEILKEGEMLF